MIALWRNPKTAREIFGLGPLEAQATINLMKHIPDAAVAILAVSASKWGMVKGPLTHAALAAKEFTVGFTTDCASPDWKRHMVNDCDVVVLMAMRLVKDWTDLPPAMRRPCGVEQVATLQKICCAFKLAMHRLEELLPGDNQVDLSNMQDSFLAGNMDAALLEAVAAGPWPWDLQGVAEVKAILAKFQADIDLKQIQKNQELKLQVATATFQQMRQELLDDEKKLDTFFARLALVRNNWGNLVITHKRKRYAAGLQKAKQVMGDRFTFMVAQPGGMATEFSSFKVKLNTALPTLSET